MSDPNSGTPKSGVASVALAIAGGLVLAGCDARQSKEVADRAAPAFAASCALCHGADGMGIEARSGPRLAGQDAAYLERQLTAFAEERRGAHPGDSFGSQMVVIAKTIDPEARKEMATYYASLVTTKAAAPSASKPTANAGALETCGACHGPNMQGLADLGAPRIAGQPAWYLEHSLRLFRDGTRGGAAEDTQGQQMAAASKGLSDADIAALAAQLAKLDGSKS